MLARYYDGQSSVAREVTLATVDGFLHIATAEQTWTIALAQCELEPQLGSQPRRIRLPDGGELECADSDGVDGLFGRRSSWQYRLERRWRYTAYALVGVVAAAVLFYWYGLPLAVRGAVWATPPQLERMIGDVAFGTLDDLGLKMASSKLDAARQRAIRQRFTALSTHGEHYRLAIVDAADIGANAFALPGGQIVLTDQLARVLNDDQVFAVLAHEAGHVERQHGLRMVYQSTGLIVLSSVLLGDVSSAAANVAGMGALLLQLGYSRDFEREADDFAAAELKQHGLSPALLGQALNALERSHAGSAKVPALLASHPDTAERIKRLER
ncbi:M48 family metallopeptidase [Chitinibacteraceae bacterium HSL-7]